MQCLEKRVAALETSIHDDNDLVILVRYVSPGHLNDEIERIDDKDGHSWSRTSCESEQELIERASREVKRNERGFGLLHAYRAHS